MKIRDREGKEVTGKEFMERWKKGMQEITPLQQTQAQMIGYIPIIIGTIWGIIASYLSHQYWLVTVLIGSIILVMVGLLGTYQKYLLFVKMEKEVASFYEPIENTKSLKSETKEETDLESDGKSN